MSVNDEYFLDNEDNEYSLDNFLEGLVVVAGGVILGAAIVWILNELSDDFWNELSDFLEEYLDNISDFESMSVAEQAALFQNFSSQANMSVFQKHGIEVRELSIEQQASLFRSLVAKV